MSYRSVYNHAVYSHTIRSSYNRPPVSGGAVVNYLLDQYPGAAVAFSTRKLSSSYTGPCLRVRRSSDNAEQDIGFVDTPDGNGDYWLDTAALLSFVGAGDGFVTTWYDQSGNTRNAGQTTAALQVLVVNAGTLITSGGIVAVQGTNAGFLPYDGTPFVGTQYLISAIASRVSNATNRWLIGGSSTETNQNMGLGWTASTQARIGQYSNDVNLTIPAYTSETVTALSAGLSSTGKFITVGGLSNADSVPTTLTANTNAALFRLRSFAADIKIQEIVFYTSSRDSDRVALLSAQKEAFGAI